MLRMKSPIDIIRGRIVDYDPRTSEVTIKAVYPDWPMMVKREYRDCNTIAVDRDFKGKNKEQETDFIDIVAWRQTAEFVSKYFTKGRMAVVEGRLQIREYTNKDGQKRRATEIVADNVYFGDSKRDDSSHYGEPASSAEGYGSGGGFEDAGIEDEECPF